MKNIMIIILLSVLCIQTSAGNLTKRNDGSFRVVDICSDSAELSFGFGLCRSAKKCAIERALELCRDNFSKNNCKKRNVKSKKISSGYRRGFFGKSKYCTYRATMNISL